MNQSGLLFLGLTAIVAALAAVLAYSLVKFIVSAREVTKRGAFDGGQTALMASAMEDALRDLRLQERAMKARAEASERLSEQIVASLTSGLLVVDHTGVIRTLNPAGHRLLGVPDNDLARPYRDVLASSAPALAELIAECLAQSQPVVRRTVKTIDGGATHLGVTVSPMRESGAPGNGAICLFTDLSKVVDLEDQLRLKDSLARLGELTAGIAHEFRNGLATIHGYSRLMDRERLPDDYRPFIDGIRSETEALGQVVTNFLNFAKPTELMVAPVDMTTIVAKAADDIRNEATARGGGVIVQGHFGRALGDEVLLRQAMSNLCRNALEACIDAGAEPRITIDGASDAEQRVLRVTVADNGPGIAPANVDRIFRPFFTTKAKGTGLGLALVQKIIVTHNGRVSVLPNDGSGARISFTLPLADADGRG
jgi:two-component system, NtrC family, sensor histidine kinase PilS